MEITLKTEKLFMGEPVESHASQGHEREPVQPASVRFGFSRTLATDVKYESFKVDVAVSVPYDGTSKGFDKAIERAERRVFDTFDFHATRLTGDDFKEGARV